MLFSTKMINQIWLKGQKYQKYVVMLGDMHRKRLKSHLGIFLKTPSIYSAGAKAVSSAYKRCP
jgi:hypothetical protein